MRRLSVFIILFGFWIAFSGHWDPLHLGFGLACAGLVAGLSHDLLFPDPPTHRTVARAWRFCAYVPWLLWEIVKANLHVLGLVVRPARIRPQVVRFRTMLSQDLSKQLLGNSITLTPGTITLDIEDDGVFHVHALSDKTAEGLLSGEMERRVAHVFFDRSTAGVAAAAERTRVP